MRSQRPVHRCKKRMDKSPMTEKEKNMKVKLLLVVAVLISAPLAIARGNAAYPDEKIAAFVVEKLDVTSLPSAFRPKKEKGKKTLTDYGYTSWKIEEKEALVETPDGAHRLSLKVLEQTTSGIYTCVAEPGQHGTIEKTQSAILLKRKDSNALLRGRDSWKEFASCPVIGGTDIDSTTGVY